MEINIFARRTDSTPIIRRDVLGLHEVSLFCGNGEQRSMLVVTLAPLLFANLRTTRSRAERWARAVPPTIALFMNSFSSSSKRDASETKIR